MDLTPKQIRFVQEYIVDFNATQAAIRAGYSKKTARQQGSRLLTNVDIQKKLRELIKQQEARTQVEADKVIQEAARIALADIGPAFNDNGTVKDIRDMPEDLRRAVSESRAAGGPPPTTVRADRAIPGTSSADATRP